VTGFAHLKAIASAASVMLAVEAMPQWSFQLDTAFYTSIEYQNVNSMLVLPDGKLIASGIMRFPGEFSDKRLVRLLPNGTRDETFYNSGLGGGGVKPWQANKFYVNAGVPRRILLPSGNNDGTFAVGSGAIPYFLPSQGADFHVYPDGRVLISGQHLLSDTARGFVGTYELVWFSNEGYLDTTRTHRNANGVIWDFAEMPDGKFLCSCSCTQYEGQPVSRLFRVHADGALDTSFQSGVNWGNILSYHPLPDGRVYAAGRFKRSVAPNDTLFVARFMPDGSLDQSFAPPHFSTGNLPNPASGANVGLIFPWEDGNLIIGGRYRYANGEPRNSICMLDSTGQLSAVFDGCGVGTFVYYNVTYTSVSHMVYDTLNAHLYLCGAYTGYDDGTTNDTLQRFVSRLLVEEDLTTGTHAVRAAPPFSAYPNPARASVIFAYDRKDGEQQGRIEVRDLAGRMLTTLMMSGHHGQQVWDTREVAPGTYVVQYFSDTQLLHTEKLIIQQ
jgi:uncharacterized delta-60 repeat protein